MSDSLRNILGTHLFPTANNFLTFWLTCTVFSICPVPASAKTTSASPIVGVSNIGICLIKAILSPTKCRPGVKKTSRNPIGLALNGMT